MINMVSDEQMILANRIIEILAIYKKYENIINAGSYVGGKNHKLSLAIEMINPINKFLKQGIFEKVDFQKTMDQMKVILN
jgi:flagellum-specific ATP synthase